MEPHHQMLFGLIPSTPLFLQWKQSAYIKPRLQDEYCVCVCVWCPYECNNMIAFMCTRLITCAWLIILVWIWKDAKMKSLNTVISQISGPMKAPVKRSLIVSSSFSLSLSLSESHFFSSLSLSSPPLSLSIYIYI